MCLLDRLVAVEAERLVAEVTVPVDGLFCRDGVVGGWVGIEYMAQAVAAWAGWQARAEGQAPPIGFLLGTRRYRGVSHFVAGRLLRVEIQRVYQADNGLGQFDCRIHDGGGAELASAQITVFGPEDPSAFLKGDIT